MNGFVVPVRDDKALADAMTRFIKQPDLIASMGRESRRLAEERFNVHEVNNRLMKILHIVKMEALMRSVLVTGATGFIGQSLCHRLMELNHSVRSAVRSLHSSFSSSGVEPIPVGNLDSTTDWSSALAGVDCVIHCAARAHVMYETESDALAAYRAVNVAGTQRLAEQAAAAGVKRLVYLSSIKVNGEQTALGAPFLFSDAPVPEDPYGVSKWEAEQALWEVSSKTGLELVVIRPPLVYGPRVKGNFLRLLRWVSRGLPLPLGAVQNQRSLVGLDNLVDLLIRCVDHPAAAGQTFLVSDGQDLSTPELIRQLADAMDK